MKEFDTNKRENVKYGTLGAIIVNGEYLGHGPPLSEEAISKAFQERLRTAWSEQILKRILSGKSSSMANLLGT